MKADCLQMGLVRRLPGTPRRQNADVCAAYIEDPSAHSRGGNLEEQRCSSVSFFTPSVCLLSSPGNGNTFNNLIIVCFCKTAIAIEKLCVSNGVYETVNQLLHVKV